MLNQKQIKKWVEALRSGKYKQTKHILNNDSGYCCLGVACKVLRKENNIDNLGRLVGVMPVAQNFVELTYLSDDFCNKTAVYLSELNDKHNFTFNEIADCLEIVYIHKALEVTSDN